MKKAGSEKRQASKSATVKDGSAGEGQGQSGDAQKQGDGKNQAKNGKPNGKGKSDKGSGKGDQSKSGKSNQKGDSKGEQNKSDNQNDSKQDSQKGDNSENNDDDQQDGEQQDSEAQDGEADGDSSSSPPRMSQTMQTISNIIKWIVWIIIAVAVIVGIVLFILKGLAPFTDWARDLLNWLRGLFGPRARESRGDQAVAETVLAVSRPKPFADFSNPFRDGSYQTRDLPELVRYTFSALDAWAWESAEGREPGETPNEFATRLSIDHSELDETPSNIAQLLMQCQFSRQPLARDGLKTLQQCWRTLEKEIRLTPRRQTV